MPKSKKKVLNKKDNPKSLDQSSSTFFKLKESSRAKSTYSEPCSDSESEYSSSSSSSSSTKPRQKATPVKRQEEEREEEQEAEGEGAGVGKSIVEEDET